MFILIIINIFYFWYTTLFALIINKNHLNSIEMDTKSNILKYNWVINCITVIGIMWIEIETNKINNFLYTIMFIFIRAHFNCWFFLIWFCTLYWDCYAEFVCFSHMVNLYCYIIILYTCDVWDIVHKQRYRLIKWFCKCLNCFMRMIFIKFKQLWYLVNHLK